MYEMDEFKSGLHLIAPFWSLISNRPSHPIEFAGRATNLRITWPATLRLATKGQDLKKIY